MKQLRNVWGVLLVAVAAAGFTNTASADPPKVGVINLSKAFDLYQLTKDLEQKFDEKRRGLSAEAEKRRAEIDLKRQELASFKPGSPDYVSRREQLTEMEVSFQIWAGVKEQQLRDSHKSWLLKIYMNIRAAVKAVANEQGIDLVLTYEEVSADAQDSKMLRDQLLLEKVIYFQESLDLTDTVVARVNKEYAGPESIDLGGIGPVQQGIDRSERRLADPRP